MYSKKLQLASALSLALCGACDADPAPGSDGTAEAGDLGKADAIDDDRDDASALDAATAEVRAALEAAGDVTQFNYCAHDGTNADGEPSIGSLKCRSLFVFDDPSMFRISFLNGAGLSGASEYAMSNGDGTFRLYVDPTLDGTPGVGEIVGENQELEVAFDKEGFPTIQGMTIHLGPTSFLFGDLSFGREMAVLEGAIVDEEAGTETGLRLTYDRVD